MSGADYFILGADGLPDGAVNIDELTERALRVAGELAIASGDPDAVAAIISEQVAAKDLPVWLAVTFSRLVIQELTVELFGPMLTAMRVEHLDTDFTAQLQSRSGINRASRAHQPGDTSPDSEPS